MEIEIERGASAPTIGPVLPPVLMMLPWKEEAEEAGRADGGTSLTFWHRVGEGAGGPDAARSSPMHPWHALEVRANGEVSGSPEMLTKQNLPLAIKAKVEVISNIETKGENEKSASLEMDIETKEEIKKSASLAMDIETKEEFQKSPSLAMDIETKEEIKKSASLEMEIANKEDIQISASLDMETKEEIRKKASLKSDIENKEQIQKCAPLDMETKEEIQESAPLKVDTENKEEIRKKALLKSDIENKEQVQKSAPLDIESKEEFKKSTSLQMDIESKKEIQESVSLEIDIEDKQEIQKSASLKMDIESKKEIQESVSLEIDIEGKEEIKKSASLKMDEEFDIDKFLDITDKEVPSPSNSEMAEELSDDEFLKQLPDIDINQSNVETPRSQISKKNHVCPKSIAAYAINSPLNRMITSLNSNLVPQHNPNLTPTTSKGVLTQSQNSQNQSQERISNISLKRSLSNVDIQNRDNNGSFSHLKKIKLDDSDKENFASSDEVSSNEEVFYNSNESEDYEENEFNNMNCNMPFPNMVETINFDVSAISKHATSNCYSNNMGDKQRETYLREKYLTTECIEQLYNSLMNTPKDEIEIDPHGLRTQLMPHQRQALQWMKWREKQKPSGGILADDMGLGKTIQLISLVLAAKNEKNANGMNNNNVDNIDEEFDDDWGISDSREEYEGGTLVVCPASLTKQWEREINTKFHRGKLSVYVYHGASRTISERKLSKFDIVITTYNLIQQEYDLRVLPRKNKDSRIFKINWERVILDEAHYIRNYKSKVCKAVCELTAKSRWSLTGTPIQNKELDLYALLKFVKCSPFDEIQVWRRWVNNKNSAGNQRLIVITKSLMLRRTKDELMSRGLIRTLPNKNLDIIKIKLDYEEKVVYQKLLLYSQSFFHEFLRQRKEKEHLKEFGCHMRPSLISREVPDKLSKLLRVLMRHHRQIEPHYILVLILRLRQICCHPALIKSMLEKEDIGDEDESKAQMNADVINELNKLMSDDEDDDECDEDGEINEKMAKNVMSKTNPVFQNNRQSSKVRAVLNTIKDVIARGEKVIVVSQWTSFLQVIANNLDFEPDAKYTMFTGKVAVKDRQEIVDMLNDTEDRLNVLLLSLTAGGVGLNLIGANNLILIDLHWNPQLETQAQDRIYRFGQENNVHIYKFICKDTIEEKIKQLQDKKLGIADHVLTGTISNKLTIEDLKLLFS